MLTISKSDGPFYAGSNKRKTIFENGINKAGVNGAGSLRLILVGCHELALKKVPAD